MTEADAKTLLKRVGLRDTRDRRLILSMLEGSKAWTVSQLRGRMRKVDLSTVYRNVTALVEAGVMRQADVRGREAYYELTSLPHHAHSVCRSCGAADCVPCPLADTATEHAIELYASCGTCAKRGTRK